MQLLSLTLMTLAIIIWSGCICPTIELTNIYPTCVSGPPPLTWLLPRRESHPLAKHHRQLCGSTSCLCGLCSSGLPCSNLATAALQYTAAELLRLRFHLPDTSPALHLFLDIARHPRRKYIHRGSQWRFYIDDSKPIQSIWSSIRQHPRHSARKVDHTVLASLARSANVSAKHKHGHTDVNQLWTI